METASGKETLTVLRRLIRYAEKVFHVSRDVMAPLSDRRLEPRISTAAVGKSALVLFWARLGSLNAWALVAGARLWQHWLHEPPCSADSLGRSHALLNAEALRHGIPHGYERLQRNTAVPDLQGVGGAVLDGHESHARYPAALCGVLAAHHPCRSRGSHAGLSPAHARAVAARCPARSPGSAAPPGP